MTIRINQRVTFVDEPNAPGVVTAVFPPSAPGAPRTAEVRWDDGLSDGDQGTPVYDVRDLVPIDA